MSAHSRPRNRPSIHRAARSALATGALALGAVLGGCGGSLGAPTATTTDPPLPAQEMCTVGHNAFAAVGELDRRKPDYLDQVKKALKPLPDRAPKEIGEDMRAWMDYVQAATDVSQLANLPADLKISTGRIDAWWKQNCGKPLIGA